MTTPMQSIAVSQITPSPMHMTCKSGVTACTSDMENSHASTAARPPTRAPWSPWWVQAGGQCGANMARRA